MPKTVIKEVFRYIRCLFTITAGGPTPHFLLVKTFADKPPSIFRRSLDSRWAAKCQKVQLVEIFRLNQYYFLPELSLDILHKQINQQLLHRRFFSFSESISTISHSFQKPTESKVLQNANTTDFP